MIESAAYDIIKQDGRIMEGRELLLDLIEARFKKIPNDLSTIISRIADRNVLKLLHRQAATCKNLDVLRKKIAQTEQ